MRKSLFELVYTTYDELGEVLTKAEMENAPNELLEAMSLSLIALRIAATRACEKKTPRVSTGRKG